jgi:arylsulfatase A-like enzyme
MDIFPTLLDILGLPDTLMTQPYDGQSITSVFDDPEKERGKPIPFRFLGKAALVDNDFKLYVEDVDSSKFALYNLADDPSETTDVAFKYPEKFEQMKQAFLQLNVSIDKSVDGADYPEKKVLDVPESHSWKDNPRYAPYLDGWKDRDEYKKHLKDK